MFVTIRDIAHQAHSYGISKLIAANDTVQQEKNSTKQTAKRQKHKLIKAILSKGKEQRIKK